MDKIIKPPVIKTTKENFRPYGTIVDTPKTDKGFVLGYVPLQATVDFGGEVEIGVFSIEQKRPFNKLERHLYTPEIFVSIEGDFILLLLESNRAKREIDFQKLKFFYIREGQTLVMKPGLWHACHWPVDKRVVFLIIFKSHTAKQGLEGITIPDGISYVPEGYAEKKK